MKRRRGNNASQKKNSTEPSEPRTPTDLTQMPPPLSVPRAHHPLEPSLASSSSVGSTKSTKTKPYGMPPPLQTEPITPGNRNSLRQNSTLPLTTQDRERLLLSSVSLGQGPSQDKERTMNFETDLDSTGIPPPVNVTFEHHSGMFLPDSDNYLSDEDAQSVHGIGGPLMYTEELGDSTGYSQSSSDTIIPLTGAERMRNLRSRRASVVASQNTTGMRTQISLGGRTQRPGTMEANIKKFRKLLTNIKVAHCPICQEAFMDLRINQQKKMCVRCGKDKNASCRKFTKSNNMDPGTVPWQLSRLTDMEEMLIAQVAPILQVSRRPGGQLSYTGHIVNFPQDVQGFLRDLPRRIVDVDVILVRRIGQAGNTKFFRVRRDVVLSALLWLKEHNIWYKDVTINQDHLNSLPMDGYIDDQLRHINDNVPDHPPQQRNESGEARRTEEGEERIGEMETVVGNPARFPNEQQFIEEQLHAITRESEAINWPSMGPNKVNEFTTEGYIAMAFPTLFPSGQADLRSPRQRTVQPAEYFKHLFRYKGQRFSAHSRFRYFAYNSMTRWTALKQGSLYIKIRSTTEQPLTLQELKKMCERNLMSVAKSVLLFGATIRGTPQFWWAKRLELAAMVDQLGLPTIFITFSAADHHWYELHTLLPGGLRAGDSPATFPMSERQKHLIKHPLLVAWFFQYRLKEFIKKVLVPLLKVKDFWGRYEDQHRGSLHFHGFLWLSDAPDVSEFEKKSTEEVKQITLYFDNIISAINDLTQRPAPEIHPCQIPLKSVLDTKEDLFNIINTCQRHTRCGRHCLRVDKKSKQQHCRYRFPKQLNESAKIVQDDQGFFQFEPERNDAFVNAYNSVVTQVWRANTDVTAIVSARVLLSYMTKYVTKSSKRSDSFSEIFAKIITFANEDATVAQPIQRLLMSTFGERDISAQEVALLVMSWPFVHSSRSFVSLNLYENAREHRRLRTKRCGRNQEIIDSDIITRYEKRSVELEGVTLKEFVAKYQYVAKTKSYKLRPPEKEYIVRVMPSVPRDVLSAAFCRQHIMLNVPFRTEAHLRQTEDETFPAAFSRHFPDGLRRVVLPNDGEIDDSDEESLESPENERLLWMVAAAMAPREICDPLTGIELGRRDIDLQEDWGRFAGILPQQSDPVTFVDECKRTFKIPRNAEVVSYESLGPEQKAAADVFAAHLRHHKEQIPVNSLRIIFSGTAGTGKSYLINYILQQTQELDEDDSPKTVLCAPSGVAAFLIKGQTIHSKFIIRPRRGNKPLNQLSGEKLKRFQDAFVNTEYIIIDEYGMVGCRLFTMMDKRCREAKPDKSSLAFGGMSVILVGDHGQLGPVMDLPLFVSETYGSTNVEVQHAMRLYRSFNMAVVLQQQQRQAGHDEVDRLFKECLLRMRVGQNTVADWELLRTRIITSVSGEERRRFDKCPRLYTTNDEADKHNTKELTDINKAIARIEAEHSGPGARDASYEDAGGLDPVVFLAVGAVVMLNVNMWTEAGLVNGAEGTVRGFIYPNDRAPPLLPVAVVVCFPRYEGPSFAGIEKGVPIIPVTRTWEGKDSKTCTRRQIPLSLAFARTVHKAQGATLNLVNVFLGTREFSTGLSFVASSRVRRLQDMVYGEGFNFDRLPKIASSKPIQQRVAEDSRLLNLGYSIDKLFSNVQSPSEPLEATHDRTHPRIGTQRQNVTTTREPSQPARSQRSDTTEIQPFSCRSSTGPALKSGGKENSAKRITKAIQNGVNVLKRGVSQILSPPKKQTSKKTAPATGVFRQRNSLVEDTDYHLQRLGLTTVNVDGDGNCLYRAIAHMQFGNANQYMKVRTDASEAMCANVELLQEFYAQDTNPGVDGQLVEPANLFEDLDAVETPGAWGSHVQLFAASVAYQRNIYLITDDGIVKATEQFPGPTMYLVYFGGDGTGHYAATALR